MGRNIVVFSDGTGQKGGVGSNTNVYKLFNMVEDRTSRQIAFYDPGLGTDWRKITGMISGRGFSKNILDCYRFIFENFEADDQIYLFGFSRGAATVRSLSGFIHLFGVLPKSRADLIPQAFDIYRIKNKQKREQKAAAFIEKHHTMWCKIKFLGVWDTVAALGLPVKWLSAVFDLFFPHKFHSFDLSESVEFARHALSIDEERKSFLPVIWNPLQNDTEEKMKQVWFAGVHTDVGGGYAEDDLSNISLKWMIQEAKDKNLLIYEKSPLWQKLLAAKPDVNGMMHNEQKKFPGTWMAKQKRSWNKITHGEPVIHESVLNRTKNSNNEDNPAYLPWILDVKDKTNLRVEA
ncbi:MAG: DUF2235 domain-containing protein [Bacteroidetes bacterium]|nr:MAG: DUF2235 domain-containing protein [Bacteroidota bacterium]